MIAAIKGRFSAFSLEFGTAFWRDELARMETKYGRDRTERGLAQSLRNAKDLDAFSPAMVEGAIPSAAGSAPDVDCRQCNGSGWKQNLQGSAVTRCDCWTKIEAVDDFKRRASGE